MSFEQSERLKKQTNHHGFNHDLPFLSTAEVSVCDVSIEKTVVICFKVYWDTGVILLQTSTG